MVFPEGRFAVGGDARVMAPWSLWSQGRSCVWIFAEKFSLFLMEVEHCSSLWHSWISGCGEDGVWYFMWMMWVWPGKRVSSSLVLSRRKMEHFCVCSKVRLCIKNSLGSRKGWLFCPVLFFCVQAFNIINNIWTTFCLCLNHLARFPNITWNPAPGRRFDIKGLKPLFPPRMRWISV